ncbi:hypothetical protein HNQ35_000097 [Cerasibacillus quisquiliarum]|nr:hypothetical protein [Cerasibacillus quisquiliarum]
MHEIKLDVVKLIMTVLPMLKWLCKTLEVEKRYQY